MPWFPVAPDDSLKPYLVRAIHEWCLNNEKTPYLLVEPSQFSELPKEYIDSEGYIIINLHPLSCHQLLLSNKTISGQARFNGKVENLNIVMTDVVAIFSKEENEGLQFLPRDFLVSNSELPQKNNLEKDAVPKKTKSKKTKNETGAKSLNSVSQKSEAKLEGKDPKPKLELIPKTK